MFPTTGILDNFNRANETPLVGATGTEWAGRNTGFDLTLAGNDVGGGGSGQTSSRYWTVATYGPDCEAYITVTILGGSTAYIRLWLRLQNPGAAGETGYMMQWSNDANGCRIFKETARETYTQLAQDTAARHAANDQLGFEAVGTAITVYKNGTSVLTTTDSTTTGAGNLALGLRDTQYVVDDFGGGTSVTSLGLAPWLTTL